VTVLLALTACIVFSSPVQAAESSNGRHLSVKVVAGKRYRESAWLGISPVRVTPQIAIWLEDDNGKFVDTIYVTRKAATAEWGADKSIRRAASLPIWSHRRGVRYPDGLYLPTREKPLPDAVTGATPPGSFDQEWTLPQGVKPGAYLIRVEVNNSFDYNESFRKDLSPTDPYYNTDYSGQPSLLWEGKVVLGAGHSVANLRPVGHGHAAGKSGEVFKNLDKITDALEILESVTVEVE
jgi:hypothetical protein